MQQYHDTVMKAVGHWAGEIVTFVEANSGLERKEFALKTKEAFDPRLQAVVFRALDGSSARDGLMEMLQKSAATDV